MEKQKKRLRRGIDYTKKQGDDEWHLWNRLITDRGIKKNI